MNEKINSYELSRGWFDWCFENPDKVRPIHTAIYFFAIEHCNRLGWKQKYGFPTAMVMDALGIKSYNTYTKALNELVEFGFIKMITKSKNQYSANIIALSKINKATNKALDKAFIKHSTKQVESTIQSNVSIDKQVNNITINKEQRTIENKKEFFNAEQRFATLSIQKQLPPNQIKKYAEEFWAMLEFQNKATRSIDEILSHFWNWMSKKPKGNYIPDQKGVITYRWQVDPTAIKRYIDVDKAEEFFKGQAKGGYIPEILNDGK